MSAPHCLPFNKPEKDLLKKALALKLHDLQERYFRRNTISKEKYHECMTTLEEIVDKLGIRDSVLT